MCPHERIARSLNPNGLWQIPHSCLIRWPAANSHLIGVGSNGAGCGRGRGRRRAETGGGSDGGWGGGRGGGCGWGSSLRIDFRRLRGVTRGVRGLRIVPCFEIAENWRNGTGGSRCGSRGRRLLPERILNPVRYKIGFLIAHNASLFSENLEIPRFLIIQNGITLPDNFYLLL